MRDHRHFLFFSERIEADRIFLDADETHHCVTVLRLSRGDPFFATDGKGTLYECAFESIVHDELAGTILSRMSKPRETRILRLFVGLPERAAFEALLGDLAALGVARITPLVCTYCQQPWWAGKWEKLSSRFRGKMVAALKQARSLYLPHLDPPLSFDHGLETAGGGLRLLADPEGKPLSKVGDGFWQEHSSIAGFIGPPGGFSRKESAMLLEQGGVPVRIAVTRLTTELAAVVLCGQVLGYSLCQGEGAISTVSPESAA
jgi:16S rRNA (uracil1498-N3)-methyltransferase